MHSGLILLTVFNISRARFLSRFTLFIDLPDSFETHNHCKSCCKVFYQLAFVFISNLLSDFAEQKCQKRGQKFKLKCTKLFNTISFFLKHTHFCILLIDLTLYQLFCIEQKYVSHKKLNVNFNSKQVYTVFTVNFFPVFMQRIKINLIRTFIFLILLTIIACHLL